MRILRNLMENLLLICMPMHNSEVLRQMRRKALTHPRIRAIIWGEDLRRDEITENEGTE